MREAEDGHGGGPIALRTALDGLRRLGVGLQRDPAAARLPVTPGLCAAPGRLALGAVATVVDCAAGLCSVLDARLDMHATTDLAVLATGRVATADAVLATPRLVHRRRAGAVIGVDVRDGASGDGPLLATATVGFAEIPGGGAAPVLLPADRPWPPADPLSLAELVAPHLAADGSLVLDLDAATRNLVGVLSGGVGLALAVQAAERVLGAPGGAHEVVAHFLAPGRAGPVRARPHVLRRGGPAGGAARVRLTDDGAAGRAILEAVVTMAALPVTGSLPSDWSEE